MSEQAPLSGIRVIDVSSTLMAPYCTLVLAQWGAEVIKIEPPGGDVVRYIGDTRGNGMGPVFLNANRGKRSVSLDLKKDGAAKVLARLLGSADILVHNLRPAAARRLGLTAEEALQANPSLVHCAFRGFAAGGRYADNPAYDDVIQAVSGMAAVQGGKGSAEYVRNAAADKTVGLMGAAAVLAALRSRDRSGQGQVVEVPMLETMASFMLLEQQGGHVFDPPSGPTGYARTESPHRRPCRTKDGHLAVMIYTDAQWHAFFEAIGRPELADEPRYRTIRERTLHIDELYALVNAELATRTTAEWQAELDDRQIPAAKVNTLDDLFEDPHLTDTGFFEQVEHPTEGTLRLSRPPVALGPDRQLLPAPLLGADTVAVLREAGVGSGELAALADTGVLPPAPAGRPVTSA